MHILVIEDDASLGSNIERWFELHHHSVELARDGQYGLDKALSSSYDCIVLDLMLPELTGWQVLHGVEQRVNTPVLVLSAIDDTQSKIRALDQGADDYLSKPFDMGELLARTHALARRNNVNRDCATVGEIKVYLKKRCAYKAEEKINFTPIEFAIIETLLANQSQAVSRFDIIESVHHSGIVANVSENALDVHISAVRKKTSRDFIQNVRGKGYLIP